MAVKKPPVKRDGLQIELPTITGKTPYEVEQAIVRLKISIESLSNRHDNLTRQLSEQPPVLTLDQIRQALSSAGTHPLTLTGLIGAVPGIGGSGGGGGGAAD